MPARVGQGYDRVARSIRGEDELERVNVLRRVRLVAMEGHVLAGCRDAGDDRDVSLLGDVAVEAVLGRPGAFGAGDAIRAVAGGGRREVERITVEGRVHGDGDAAERLTGVRVRDGARQGAEARRQVDGERDRDRDLGLLRSIRDEDDRAVVLTRRQVGRPEVERDGLAVARVDRAGRG